jgi:hypothetical protein
MILRIKKTKSPVGYARRTGQRRFSRIYRAPASGSFIGAADGKYRRVWQMSNNLESVQKVSSLLDFDG